MSSRLDLLVLVVFGTFHLASLAAGIALSYIGTHGNQYVVAWPAGFGIILDFQALHVHRRGGHKRLWTVYSALILIFAILIMIGNALDSEPYAAVVAATLLVPTIFIFLCRTNAKEALIRRTCGRRTLNFCGWTSLFMTFIFLFFIMLQAMWSGVDAKKYPPTGIIQQITLESNLSSPLNVGIHIDCRGPLNSSTFVMFPGGGSPSFEYVRLQSLMVDAGKRFCLIDRMDYGWSDIGPLPITGYQQTEVVQKTLNANGEKGPFILTGHSAGGELARLFAAIHPDLTAGIAILDGYSYPYALAEDPYKTSNTSVKAGFNPGDISRIIDLYRAASILGWVRLATSSYDFLPSDRQDEHNALYGKNKEWHGQYAEYTCYQGATESIPCAYEILVASSNNKVTIPQLPNIQYPRLSNPSTPVLVIAANTTYYPASVYGIMADSYASDLTGPEYGRLVICPDGQNAIGDSVGVCDHGFPTLKAAWLTEILVSYFK